MHHPQNLPLTLEITVATGGGDTTVTVLAEGEPVDTLQSGPDFSSHIVQLPQTDVSLVKLQLITNAPTDEIIVSRIGLAKGVE